MKEAFKRASGPANDIFRGLNTTNTFIVYKLPPQETKDGFEYECIDGNHRLEIFQELYYFVTGFHLTSFQGKWKNGPVQFFHGSQQGENIVLLLPVEMTNMIRPQFIKLLSNSCLRYVSPKFSTCRIRQPIFLSSFQIAGMMDDPEYKTQRGFDLVKMSADSVGSFFKVGTIRKAITAINFLRPRKSIWNFLHETNKQLVRSFCNYLRLLFVQGSDFKIRHFMFEGDFRKLSEDQMLWVLQCVAMNLIKSRGIFACLCAFSNDFSSRYRPGCCHNGTSLVVLQHGD